MAIERKLGADQAVAAADALLAAPVVEQAARRDAIAKRSGTIQAQTPIRALLRVVAVFFGIKAA